MSKSARGQHPIPAVGGLVIRDDKILLIKRANPPRAGQWSIPGGKVDWGERLVDAVVREVREETGLNVRAGDHLITLESITGDRANPDFHYVLIDYLCECLDDSDPNAGDGVTEARFATRAEAMALVDWPATRDTIDQAFDAWHASKKEPAP